ncbi:MAG: segregation/condensation protein A [Phycisphaerales bacterium]|nr:segregation/condensation protein A [Phycisphaerales bacterium]
MTDYRVQTDVYNGPLDLLLYLIRRDEIDIYDIPVARVTEQYVEYVELLKVIDPNVAGDFLVMATVLMELKSRMLLPRPVVEDGEPEDLADPRLELVRQLLEYKKFKDASFELNRAADIQAQRWPRVPARFKPEGTGEVDLDDVQIWDLVASFNKIMSAIGAGQVTHDVVFDDTPISLHAADILDRLDREGGSLMFADIFVGRNKVEMIGLFLALLELMRQRRVRVTQEVPMDPIRINLLSPEPIEVGDEWKPAIHEALTGLETNE